MKDVFGKGVSKGAQDLCVEYQQSRAVLCLFVLFCFMGGGFPGHGRRGNVDVQTLMSVFLL